ncbi:MAG: type II secretion system F family protein, partial [Planctomycetota bacterium]
MVLPATLVALVTGWFLLVASRSVFTLEFRARILEVLAQAAAHGLAPAPLFARAAAEHRGRRRRALERMHARIEAGAPLSEACALAFPRHVVGAIRASEGGAALAATLAWHATDASERLFVRHRAALTLVYPLLLGCLLLLLQGNVFGHLVEVEDAVRGERSLEGLATIVHASAALVVGGALVGLAFRRRLPGARLLAGGRLLHAMAPHLAAGAAWPAALRRAADAA